MHLRIFIFTIASLFLFVPTLYAQPSALPAFPGAEGFGSKTIGGRGGRVIEVTNLNDSGSESLRQALEATGPRIVIFRVGGTIKVTGQIHITNPYLTVAGQTAPGDGITIRGGVFNIGTHDVIVRGIRVRMGDEPAQYPPDERDSIGLVNLYSGQDVYNVILDHVSASWGIDENLSIWSAPNLYGGKSFHDITLQWSIISEGLYNSIHPKGSHSMGLLVGDRSKRISVHHNLFAHNNQRNPLLKGDTQTEVINNYIYDWGGSPTAFSDSETRGASFTHIINNFYQKGPSTRSNLYGVHFSSASVGTKAYVRGNIGPTRPTDSLPEWDIVSAGNTQFEAANLIFTPSGITTQTAVQAQNLILQKAGVTHPARDAVDQRILSEAGNGTGQIIDSQTQVGGWPALASGVAPIDTDHDGMPDSWETAHGLKTILDDSTADRDADGYTNVEEYINGLIDTASPTSTPSVTPQTTPTIIPSATPSQTPSPPPQCLRKKQGDADCNNTINIVDFEIWRKEFFPNCSQANLSACGTDEDNDGSPMDANFNYPGSSQSSTDSFVNLLDFEIWRKEFFII